jgi:hypothetical protein
MAHAGQRATRRANHGIEEWTAEGCVEMAAGEFAAVALEREFMIRERQRLD